MSKPTFVYTTYIRTTPEQLWKGLTDPAFTKRYWNTTFETDWQAGSTDGLGQPGRPRSRTPSRWCSSADPYTRLSYTWHTFTPELAAIVGFSAEQQATPRRRAPLEGDLRHRGPAADGEAHRHPRDGRRPTASCSTLVSGGWPQVLAALKTLLETGRAPSEPAA